MTSRTARGTDETGKRFWVGGLLLGALLACVSGCDEGEPPPMRIDAQFSWPDGAIDAGPSDAGPPDGGPPDGDVPDASRDAGPTDSGPMDAGLRDAGPTDSGPRDAGPRDAGPPDGGTDGAAGPGGACPDIAAGDTIELDGDGDLAAFPTEQLLAPGAPVTAGDQVAVTWDRDALYIAVVSDAFMGDGLRPFHLYIEAADSLAPAMASRGKEYDGLTPHLEFTPTALIAFRSADGAGGGPSYSAVYGPGADWTDVVAPLSTGTELFLRADHGGISVRVPWTAIGGCARAIRLSAHLVHAVVDHEWKTLLPAGATPWGPPGASDGGAYYEIDLTSDPAISGWTLR